MTTAQAILRALGRMHLAGLDDYGRYPRDDAKKLAMMAQVYAEVWGDVPVSFMGEAVRSFCRKGGRFPSAAEFAAKGRELYQATIPQLPPVIQPIETQTPISDGRREWLRQKFGCTRPSRRMSERLEPVDDPSHEAKVRAQAERLKCDHASD